jgi:hypothetical protein
MASATEQEAALRAKVAGVAGDHLAAAITFSIRARDIARDLEQAISRAKM